MPKTLANVIEPEAQRDVAKRLRQLADDIESGVVQVVDLYASLNLLDTTPEGAESETCEPDPTSYLLLLRFARQTSPR